MPVAAQVIEMAGGSDAAKQLIFDELRPFLRKTQIRTVGHDVLIAVYNRAGQKTAAGIIIPNTYREDDFQGKIGLILALGPMCCEDNSPGYNAWFGHKTPEVGDWVGLSTKDGMAFILGERTCRLVEWKYLRFLTNTPDQAM